MCNLQVHSLMSFNKCICLCNQHHNQDIDYFHHSMKSPWAHPTPAPGNHRSDFFSPRLVLSALGLHISRNYAAAIILCLFFCSACLRLIHVVAQSAVHLSFIMSNVSCYEHTIICLFACLFPRLELLWRKLLWVFIYRLFSGCIFYLFL